MRAGVRANTQRVRVGGSAGESAGFERESLTKIVPSIPAKNTRPRRYDFSAATATASRCAIFWSACFPLVCRGLMKSERRVPRRRCDSRPKLLERPKVTAIVDVEIRLSARWRELLRRHCSVPHYAERRHDSDPDSCRLSCLIS